MAKTGVSLNPENFVEGGGLIDDVDVTFKECSFEMFDYNGTVQPGSPSLKVVMVDDDGNDMEQYYSMGSANDWIPSEDGSQLVAVGKATSIKVNTNGGILLKSLVDAGFPADKLGDDITILNGLVAHVIRVPAPKRAGVKLTDKQKEKEEKYGPPTLLIVGEIKTLPWEKKTPKGAPATKGKPPAGKPAGGKAAPAPAKAAPKTAVKEEEAGDDDLNTKAITVVLEILEAAGTITKKELPAKIFQQMKTDPDRNAIVKLVFDDEFLGGGPWTYEDGTLIGA